MTMKKKTLQVDFEKFLKHLPNNKYVCTRSNALDKDIYYSFVFCHNIYVARCWSEGDQIRIKNVTGGSDRVDKELYNTINTEMCSDWAKACFGTSKLYQVNTSSDKEYIWIFDND